MNWPILQLEDFGITDLEVHWLTSEIEGQDYKSNLQLGYGIQKRSEEEQRYRIVLRIADERKSEEGRVQLTLRATAIGFFVFPESTPVDQHPRLIRTVGLPILYSTARGALQAISGTLPPDSRYILPTVNVVELITAIEGGEGSKNMVAVDATAGQKATLAARTEVGKVATS